jgi:thiol-disulfide isomerase/thioredoxin
MTLNTILNELQIATDKPVILKFWDKECPGCLEEIPITNQLHAEISSGMSIIGVCMNELGVDMNFINEKKITWPQVSMSWGHPLIKLLNITQIPETIFIDEQKNVALFDIRSKVKTVLNKLHSTRPLDGGIKMPIAPIEPPKKIEVRDAGAKGAGVFAVDGIKLNEVIEVCYVIEPAPNSLNDYVFRWQNFDEPSLSKEVIPLGYGCIYNHSSKANATWRQHPECKAFEFIATRDIEKGEEICTFYGGDDYWQARGIVPVE